MLNFLSQNIGTIAVCVCLAVVIFFIVRKMVKDKKAGKSSCGCNCSACAMHGECHKK